MTPCQPMLQIRQAVCTWPQVQAALRHHRCQWLWPGGGWRQPNIWRWSTGSNPGSKAPPPCTLRGWWMAWASLCWWIQARGTTSSTSTSPAPFVSKSNASTPPYSLVPGTRSYATVLPSTYYHTSAASPSTSTPSSSTLPMMSTSYLARHG